MREGEFLTKKPALEPSAASRTIEGEAVVVTPRDSNLHTFNETGTRILELCDGTRTVAEIVERLVEEFEVDRDVAVEDVGTFVSELVEKGILVFRDDPLPVR